MENRPAALRPGYRKAVYDLQNMLYTLARHRDGVRVIPDGIFGPRTAEAVRQFQTKNQLPVIGEADTKTFNEIARQFSMLKKEMSETQKADFFPNAGHRVRSGEKDMSIYVVQLIFQKLAEQFSAYEKGEICGHLNKQTENNIRRFQRICGLAEHGELDRATWDKIIRYYNLYEAQ